MAVQESKLVIVIDSKNALKTTNEVAAGLENLTKKGDQAETQMTAMSASIISLVGYMGGILTINKAIAMDQKDVETLEKLKEMGVTFDVRKVPADSKENMDSLLKKAKTELQNMK